ncbi:GntR family transcriptional regulator [Actinoalloteichus hymeniacidonis]|uniref:Transcriptional regulator, GntR family n=1 Tax=Actinoalloteichus hymeniacidonis TaxID=340345 RepID=A0AAC9N0W5_9PSEU|nr:GntR family transcriptional regulator [Actinoalloteichus hymeniacidonis]AOS65296.1 transcriptional regulator, GntR family [Actinoalloteichus hymeniacidonis]MBB5906619.1 GntR family transcriptional regulator [Actinoalloteichus hymeniacidonis]
MIHFRVSPSSGVPPYLQLVHQVEQGIALGYLNRGDQLPTVKGVARMLAINPNTVLKAYRELENKGLVQGRPGRGTFVSAEAENPLPEGSHDELRRTLAEWIRSARAAGLDADRMTGLFNTVLHESDPKEKAE